MCAIVERAREVKGERQLHPSAEKCVFVFLFHWMCILLSQWKVASRLYRFVTPCQFIVCIVSLSASFCKWVSEWASDFSFFALSSLFFTVCSIICWHGKKFLFYMKLKLISEDFKSYKLKMWYSGITTQCKNLTE